MDDAAAGIDPDETLDQAMRREFNRFDRVEPGWLVEQIPPSRRGFPGHPDDWR